MDLYDRIVSNLPMREGHTRRSLGNDAIEAETVRQTGSEVYYRLNSGTHREFYWSLADGPIHEDMTDCDFCCFEPNEKQR